MHIKILLMFLMVFMIMPGTAQGIVLLYDCENGTHLTVTGFVNISGNVYDYSQPDILCPHGCEDNITKYGADCIEPPFILTLEIIIGVVLLFGFIVFVGSRKR